MSPPPRLTKRRPASLPKGTRWRVLAGALVAACVMAGATCTAQEPANVSPPSSAVATIPFVYDGHVFVPTVINDSLEGALLFDPVRGVYLDGRFVRAHGLRVYGGEAVGYGGPVYAGGAGGAEHLVTFVRDVTVRFGGMALDFPLAPVIPLDSMMAGSLGRTADGLFGVTLLQDYVVEIDFAASQFVLHDTTTFAVPTGAVEIPITWTAHTQRPAVPLTLHLADGEDVTGSFLLDFGMEGTFRATTGFTDAHRLPERFARADTSRQERGLGGALESVFVHPPALSVGTLRVEWPLLSLAREQTGADAFPESHEGLIGLGFLSRYRAYYDAPGSRLVLVEAAAPSLIARAQAFRSLIARGDYEAARAMMAPDSRRWWERREGPGQPWAVGAGVRGPWAGWDEHFRSASEVVEWRAGDRSATAVVRETNDYFRLLERGWVTNEITYSFDEQGRIAGLLISATGERPPGRTEEFLAWARAHAPEELAQLMPDGEIDPSGDHPQRFRRLLDRWRRAAGLGPIE